jgi:D-3-phosphoglycerate dehydrogenase
MTTVAPARTLNILVGDKLAQQGLDYLKSNPGVNVDIKVGLKEDEIAAIIGNYDGLLVRSGVQVTAKVLAHPGKLKAIARAGVGVDNIDLDAATRGGVLVMNSADASTVTTAEHAFTLLMALARNIGPAYKTMADGGWDRNKFVGRELRGKTLGIVGFGRIGRTVAVRALAFEMKVISFDPVFNAETALDGKVKMVKSFDELVAQSDFVSFHVPLNDHTRNMFNAERFDKAKKGIMIVNAARGGVIDLEALEAAIASGKCGGAALDVFEVEPLDAASPLRKNPKILLTPHLGASTVEAQDAVSNDACAQLLEYLKGEGIRGAVNAAGVRLDLDPTQAKFVDLAQRAARLIAPMCEAGIGEVTVTLKSQALAGAANTIERMVLVELLNSSLDVPVNVVNAKLVADQRGIKIRAVVEDNQSTPRLIIEVKSGKETRRIAGAVFSDGQPRVLEINGYHMDIVPNGPMVFILNEDKPGMIGMVGNEFGSAGANIADMALSRRGTNAMMVLKLDQAPDKTLLDRLRGKPGIVKVAAINLQPSAKA